jgi:23S rRNA (uracil1939-C5)-methyltransferase
LLTPDLIELTIDSLSYHGGRGVGRFEGVVVFVGGTAPGDRIRARVTVKKPRLWEAELVEVLEPGPSRRQAPCPVAAVCGGCPWQHVEYAAQIEQKKKILSDSLRNLKKFGEFETQEFLAAPSEFGYRNRIQVQVQGSKFGFFAKKSHQLAATDHCLISEDAINERLKKLAPDLPGAKRIEIAVTETGDTALMRDERDPEAALFSQVNTAQNEVMKKRMLELIDIEPEWIFDLYAGAGNLTRPLSERFPEAETHGFEFSAASIKRAEKAGGTVSWHVGDVEKTLARVKAPPGEGLVVLDPPRPGASKAVLDLIAALNPKQILYISCNPTTFSRDVQRWLESGRFQLRSVQGLDMFPQTEHVELLASLRAAT